MSMASAKVVAIGFSSKTGFWDAATAYSTSRCVWIGRRYHNCVYPLIQARLTEVAIDGEWRVGEQAPVRARPLETPFVGVNNALHGCPID